MAHGAGTVTATRLNVRLEPISGKVLGVLLAGTHVIVWSALPSGWDLVQADDSGLTGWVLGKWIQLDAELVRGGANGNESADGEASAGGRSEQQNEPPRAEEGASSAAP